MDDRSERLASGFWIVGTPAKSYPYTDIATVRMRGHRLTHNVDMTPDEADALADALKAEAEHARSRR